MKIDALDDQFIATVCQETALPEARIRGERGRPQVNYAYLLKYYAVVTI